jgi:predicted DNA-binding protein
MHTIRFDTETEQSLTAVASRIGIDPETLIKEAVQRYLEDWEDRAIAEERLQNPEPTVPLEQVVRDLGLED